MRNLEEDEIYTKQKLEILREEQNKNLEIEKKYLFLQEEINKIILKYEKMNSEREITKLTDLENGKLYNLICFRGYKNDSYLCLFKKNDSEEKTYLIWADLNIKNRIKYIEKLKKHETHKNLNFLIKDYEKYDFLAIRKIRNEYKNNYLNAVLDVIYNKLIFRMEEPKTKDKIIFKEGKPLIKNCKKLEDLEENKRYKLLSICETNHGKTTKYIMNLKSDKNEIIEHIGSNYFLEDILNNYDIKNDIIGRENIDLITRIKRTHTSKKVKLLDCIMNIVDNEEVKEIKENINDLNKDINETNEKNKQEWITKINEEFNHVNENFNNLDDDFLNKFYEKYKNKYSYDKDPKYYILGRIESYFDDKKESENERLKNDNDENN